MVVFKILLILLLLFISFQDFKYKAVWWIAFPIGFILSVLLSYSEISLNDLVFNTLFNLLFIAFQLGVIMLFSWIKFKQFKNIFTHVFGLGDLLFLVMICSLFSPFNFVLFYVLSLAFSLIFYLILKILKIYNDAKIPLAGLQSIFLVIAICIDFFSKFNFYNDYQILEYILG